MIYSPAKTSSITSFGLITILFLNLLSLPHLERPDNVHDGETVIKEDIGLLQNQAMRRSPEQHYQIPRLQFLTVKHIHFSPIKRKLRTRALLT